MGGGHCSEPIPSYVHGKEDIKFRVTCSARVQEISSGEILGSSQALKNVNNLVLPFWSSRGTSSMCTMMVVYSFNRVCHGRDRASGRRDVTYLSTASSSYGPLQSYRSLRLLTTSCFH